MSIQSTEISSLTDLSARLDRAESRYVRAEKRFRVLCGALLGAIVVAVSLPFVSPAVAQGYGITLAQAATRIAALETKTASMTAITDPNTKQATVRFTGVNVQIVSGSGSTEDTANGTGNLIVGYNETRTGYGADNTRTGSHNLVVGRYNNYYSYGGTVIGNGNTAFAQYCSVSGTSNVASGVGSSVSGGSLNIASGFGSSVSGGRSNTASGENSSVSGGYNRTVSTTSGWGAGTINNYQFTGYFSSP